MYCEYLDYLEAGFDRHFSQRGYKREEPVAVSSRVDPTVDFVGSKISPLKHFVLNGNIAEQGHYLIQDCFRTRGMKMLKTLEPSKFGSCFKTMGTLTIPEDMERVVSDTCSYLTKGIEIRQNDLLIKTNGEDEDLILAINSVAGNVPREENAIDAHYIHRYGLDEQGIFGRDFNIAVRNQRTNEFVNVGTVVLIEQRGRKIGIDMGIGNLALAMCHFGKDNTVSASRMADVIDIDGIEKQRLADALMALALLQKEGVHDISRNADSTSRNFRWKFKTYENAVVYWMKQFGLSVEQVLEYMQRYISLEFKIDDYKSEATWLR